MTSTLISETHGLVQTSWPDSWQKVKIIIFSKYYLSTRFKSSASKLNTYALMADWSRLIRGKTIINYDLSHECMPMLLSAKRARERSNDAFVTYNLLVLNRLQLSNYDELQIQRENSLGVQKIMITIWVSLTNHWRCDCAPDSKLMTWGCGEIDHQKSVFFRWRTVQHTYCLHFDHTSSGKRILSSCPSLE